MENIYIKIKLDDNIQGKMEKLTNEDSDPLDRALLRGQLMEHVQSLSKDMAHKFINDNTEYFSDSFKEELLNSIGEGS